MEPGLEVAVGTGLLITVSMACVASLVLLFLALRAGKDKAQRPWAWAIGLVLLGISVAFHLVLATGVTARLLNAPDTQAWEAGLSDAPIVIGTAALVVSLVAAFWRPVWAGWFLLATAAAIPPVLWLVQLAVREDQTNAIPAAVLLMTYSVPTAVISIFLLLSGSSRKTAQEAGVMR